MLTAITDRERELQEEVARLREVEQRFLEAQQNFYAPNAQLQAEVERQRETLADWLKANGPGGWIDIIRADNERLRAELAARSAKAVTDEIADACRVMAWANTPNRRPANLAFTAGLERQAAYWIGWAEQQYALRGQAGEPVAITDEMALAFHRAIGDGSIGQSEVNEIKAGLAAAFANHAAPQPQDAALQELSDPVALYPCGFKQLHCLVIENCAFLARGMVEGEPVTDDLRAVAMYLVGYAKDMAALLAKQPLFTAPHPVTVPDDLQVLTIAVGKVFEEYGYPADTAVIPKLRELLAPPAAVPGGWPAINIISGTECIVTGEAVNTTHGNEGQVMVIYRYGDLIRTCAADQFHEKFRAKEGE